MATKCSKCRSENPETATFCADCGTRLSLHEGIPVSVTKTLISPAAEGSFAAGRYRILGKLGEGGMGIVYKAEDTRLKRIVALKFMPPELTRDSEAKERFIREAQAAAALSHPHICTVHEIAEDENRYFIAMECIEGQSLKEKILKGPLDHAEALNIAIQVAEGLEEAHKKGIVHRDIKPGNIMVTEKVTAKVMDFGLAKVFGASFITKDTKTMGTVAYMSPEQAQGQSVDHRTDIWSLGIVLYEILTGRLPFKGEYDQSVIHSILNHEPEPLTKVLPNLPKPLENVVLTALAKNPTDRYQSMGELLEDLRAIAEGLKPLRARGRPLKGRILGIKKAYFYAGFMIFIALIASALIFLFPGRSEVFDSVAILPIINESGDTDKEYFANSLTRQLNAELYKVAALTVPPAESIMAFKGSDKPPKKIAQELKVKTVVHVYWLQIKSRHRLTYTLTDPFRNKVIAADTLERDGEDIFFLQGEFARAIVSAIKVAVTPAEQALMTGTRKVSPEAYDLCMQGIELYSSYGLVELNEAKSIECFQRAVEIDPGIAMAHAWLVHMYVEAAYGNQADEKEIFLKAQESVRKALEIDENLAMAYSSRGLLNLAMNWDFAGAEQDLMKALELAPGDMWIPVFYGAVLCASGRGDEAIASLKRRFEARNISGLEGLYSSRQTLHFLWSRRYDEALEEARKIPTTGQEQLILAIVKASKGAHTEALDIVEKLKNQPVYSGDPWFRTHHAWILALAGRRKEALEALEEHVSLQTRKNIRADYDVAVVHAGLGEKDKALEYLNKAYNEHSSRMVWLIADVYFHSLHGDPQFEELAKKIGFPQIPPTGKR